MPKCTMAPKTAGIAAAIGIPSVAALYSLDQKFMIRDDMQFVYRMLKSGILSLAFNETKKGVNIVAYWYSTLVRYGGHPCLICAGRTLTFRDVETLSNQMVQFIQTQFREDDTVGLLMHNKPEFICWMLALLKANVKIAFVNTSIALKPLAHCLQAAHCVGVIFDDETANQIFDMHDAIAETRSLRFVLHGVSSDRRVKTISPEELSTLFATPCNAWKRTCMTDTMGYIYTSGTTGLPKAGIIVHRRFIGITALFSGLSCMTPNDIIYDCLPLFHTTGLIPIGCTIFGGAATCIGKKFSPTQFWKDVAQHRCTAFQYVGEIGRFLVNHAQSHPEVLKVEHCLRVAMGNGLRPDIWKQFREGFRIPLVMEFYGSTEGNGILVNLCDRRAHYGSIGRYGAFLRAFFGYRICRFDVDSETLVRDSQGRCIDCGPNEVGELLLPIKDYRPETKFQGYTDEKESDKKIARDVCVKGDKYFRTGDLVSRKDGCYYFDDRIGDTFRWMGENVSTTEVSQVVSGFPGIAEANVYGVKVPNAPDGRACMVALTVETSDFVQKLPAFYEFCAKNLPKYAVPRFVRLLSSGREEHTSTFKQVKGTFRNDGCDPSKAKGDDVYYMTPKNTYEILTPELYESWRPSKL